MSHVLLHVFPFPLISSRTVAWRLFHLPTPSLGCIQSAIKIFYWIFQLFDFSFLEILFDSYRFQLCAEILHHDFYFLKHKNSNTRNSCRSAFTDFLFCFVFVFYSYFVFAVTYFFLLVFRDLVVLPGMCDIFYYMPHTVYENFMR